ncbi:GCC2 and GCC3 domain containing protein [Carpediemonas membranifera]|uniref:GCC2 and GCC3 domain containing protein n=1 Tax=Carpediemonas membranifera TaxID=201153 RepID=A0A8J6B882_9EUKA|nr:GCC2 and GCC3 domain containing protein [Carpediemonas membranifera]|eukprot:KAG9397653.1 GCC2 and GCC3 domain containing protein [Carpediemonas membranifera]
MKTALCLVAVLITAVLSEYFTTFEAFDADLDSSFASSVYMTGDKLYLGAPRRDDALSNVGAVYEYVLGYEQPLSTGTVITPVGSTAIANGFFGSSFVGLKNGLAISHPGLGDGFVLYYDDEEGTAKNFTGGMNPLGIAGFGAFLAASDDTLVIGSSPATDKVVVCPMDPVTFQPADTYLTVTLPSAITISSIAISDRFLAIAGSNTVYMYSLDRTDGTVSGTTHLHTITGLGLSISLALSDEYLVYGEPYHSGVAPMAGKISISAISPSSTLADPQVIQHYNPYANFGSSVSIYDDRVAAGSPNATVSSQVAAGTVYVYKETTTWGMDLEIFPPSPVTNGRVGDFVSITSRGVLAGSPTVSWGTGLGMVFSPQPSPSCDAGTHTDGWTSCADCEIGTASAKSNAPACMVCDAGHYQDSTGMNACSSAGVGTYVPDDDVPHSTVKNCGVGTYNNETAASACTAVPVGYEIVDGRTAIQPCSAGSYQDTTAQDSCKTCAAGYSTADDGKPHLQCTRFVPPSISVDTHTSPAAVSVDTGDLATSISTATLALPNSVTASCSIVEDSMGNDYIVPLIPLSGSTATVAAGTYTMTVTLADSSTASISLTFDETLSIPRPTNTLSGSTLTGTVTAAACPAAIMFGSYSSALTAVTVSSSSVTCNSTFTPTADQLGDHLSPASTVSGRTPDTAKICVSLDSVNIESTESFAMVIGTITATSLTTSLGSLCADFSTVSSNAISTGSTSAGKQYALSVLYNGNSCLDSTVTIPQVTESDNSGLIVQVVLAVLALLVVTAVALVACCVVCVLPVTGLSGVGLAFLGFKKGKDGGQDDMINGNVTSNPIHGNYLPQVPAFV